MSGRGGIRTHEELALLAVFRTAALGQLCDPSCAEEVRFELTRALRLKGLANPRNGPLSDSSVPQLYQEARYLAIVTPHTNDAPARLRAFPADRRVAPVVHTSSNKRIVDPLTSNVT